ncbi:MAG TPA: choice-of-anchor Q domain-containing protein [Thermoanaerobaculaceae bacterium]|nr:choice-of-anchor Q domain-containing protein [Thermoanaerobaculaceae bacterium]
MRVPNRCRAGVAALISLAAWTKHIPAATLTVTNTNDSGAGSLRAQIGAATDGDTILFDASLTGQTILLTTGEIPINSSLTVTGLGSANLMVAAGLSSRIFTVAAGKSVAISGLELANGEIVGATGASGPTGGDGSVGTGGAILNHGSLTVSGCLFYKNFAYGGDGGAGAGGSSSGGNGGDGAGGAVYTDTGATLVVTNCQFDDNAAFGGKGGDGTLTPGLGGNGRGGALEGAGATTVSGSSFSGNSAVGGVGGSSGGFGGNGFGGAIDAAGPLALSLSQLSSNTATGATAANDGSNGDALGGALHLIGSTAVATMHACSIAGNAATAAANGDAFGGGIVVNFSATLTIDSSTLSGNQAGGGSVLQGGGLDAAAGSTVDLTNVTFAGNSAAGGGALSTYGALSMVNCTVDGNSATTEAGGVLAAGSGTATATNSIVAQNSAPTGPDGEVTAGTVTSGGHNVIGVAFTQGGGTFTSGAGDQIGTSGTPLDPKLTALANNGGPTQTMALQLTSPALDHGDDAQCPAFDQTTLTSRPQGAHCDAGAYEVPTVAGSGGNAFTLTVVKTGTGSGTVSSAPTRGIDCGVSCSWAYFAGTNLTLTATPGTGAQFAGWGGGCSGIALTAPVLLNANTTCTAQFDLPAAVPELDAEGFVLMVAVLGLLGWAGLRRR